MRAHPLALRTQPLALLACLGALAACDVKVHNGDMDVEVFSAEAKQEWTRNYQIPPGGQLEIANLNGPIELAAAATASVDVRADIIARGLTDAIARDVLAKGKIEETVSPERIKIETVIPRGLRGRYEVRYYATVPAGIAAVVSTTNGALKATGLGSRMKASIVNGAVQLTDMTGPIDAAVVNGSLSTKLALVTSPVRLETTNGRLSLELPKAAKATLSARVVNGGLTVTGLPVEDPPQRRIRNLEAVLNGGGPPIDLHATNGRITISGTP